MPKKKIKEKLDWDDLIAEGKQRIKELKRSINHWQEMKDTGEKFPVDLPKPPKRTDVML